MSQKTEQFRTRAHDALAAFHAEGVAVAYLHAASPQALTDASFKALRGPQTVRRLVDHAVLAGSGVITLRTTDPEAGTDGPPPAVTAIYGEYRWTLSHPRNSAHFALDTDSAETATEVLTAFAAGELDSFLAAEWHREADHIVMLADGTAAAPEELSDAALKAAVTDVDAEQPVGVYSVSRQDPELLVGPGDDGSCLVGHVFDPEAGLDGLEFLVGVSPDEAVEVLRRFVADEALHDLEWVRRPPQG